MNAELIAALAKIADRAKAANITIDATHIASSVFMLVTADQFICQYRGTNDFINSLARQRTYNHQVGNDHVRLIAREPKPVWAALSNKQYAAALKFAIRNLPTSTPAAAETTTGVYMDLRSKQDRLVADIGDVAINATETITPVVPNAYYTVIVETRHYTIRLTDCPENLNQPAGTQLASVLVDRDNESDTSYIGFAFVTGGTFWLWKKYNTGYIGWHVALTMLLQSPTAAMQEYVLQSGNCAMCGRKLTVSTSIKAGIGPQCAKKLASYGLTMPAMLDVRPIDHTKAMREADELFAD